MKKLILILFFCLVNLTSSQVQSNNLLQQLEVDYEKELDFNPDKAFAFNSHIYLIQNRNESYSPILVCLDIEGNEIFKKYFDTAILDVSVTDDGELIAISTSRKSGECYYCIEYFTKIYDRQGVLISKIKSTTYHTKISKDGNYLITTRVEEGEQQGQLEVFEINTGEKLQLPISKKYSYFFADFISSTKVVLVTHHVSHTRDETQARRSRENIKLQNIVDSLTIFDLSTNMIEINKELNYSKTKFFSTIINKEALWIAPEEKGIFIYGKIKQPESKASEQRSGLLVLNSKGDKIWEKSFEKENNEFEGVDDIEFIDRNNALILKYGILNSEFILVDIISGNEKWNHNLGSKFTGKINGFLISDSPSILSVDFKSYKESFNLLMKFTMRNGEMLEQQKNNNILTKSLNNIVLKQGNRIIKGKHTTMEER